MLRLLSGLAVITLLAVTSFFFYRQRNQQTALTALPSASIWADGYSAEFINRDLVHPAKSSSGRIYVNALSKPQGIRQETDFTDHRRIRIFGVSPRANNAVLDPDAKIFWKPKTSASLTVRLSRPGQPTEPLAGGEDARRRYIGREQVNGRDAEHWEITEPLPNGTPLVWQYWEDIRLNAAVREDKPGISFYELGNIHEGSQPASLFELPDDYREVSPPQNQRE